MPIKVKFLLGIMTTAAVLIGLGFFINIRGFNLGANILETLKNNEFLNLGDSDSRQPQTFASDIDKDGLPDEEEALYRTDPLNPDTDGDGFLDGEEILLGHDPTLQGPDDLLLSRNKNLTEKLAGLAMAGLYEGSLKPDSPNYDRAMDTVVLTVLDDALKNLNQFDADNLRLKLVEPTKINQESYLKEFSKIYEGFLNAYLTEMKVFTKKLDEIGESGFGSPGIQTYFSDKSVEFQEIFEKLPALSVPTNWESNHLNFIGLPGELIEINSSIASGASDPIKAMVALNRLAGILDALPILTESFVKKIAEQNLDATSTIFQR